MMTATSLIPAMQLLINHNFDHGYVRQTLTAAAIGLPLDFLKLMVSTKTIGAVKAGTHTNLEEGEDGGGGKSIRSLLVNFNY